MKRLPARRGGRRPWALLTLVLMLVLPVVPASPSRPDRLPLRRVADVRLPGSPSRFDYQDLDAGEFATRDAAAAVAPTAPPLSGAAWSTMYADRVDKRDRQHERALIRSSIGTRPEGEIHGRGYGASRGPTTSAGSPLSRRIPR
jgi:hypothetical protein